MYLLNLLTGLLPTSLQPYAKAIYPAVATLVAVGVQFVSDGTLDTTAVATAISGAFASIITLLIPNKPVA